MAKATAWNIGLSRDGLNYLLSYDAKKSSEPLDFKAIITECATLNLSAEELLDRGEIEKVLWESEKNGLKLTDFCLTKNTDAKIEIEVIEESVVKLNLAKGLGKGRRLTMESVEQEINNQELVGVKVESYVDAVDEFLKSRKHALKGLIVFDLSQDSLNCLALDFFDNKKRENLSRQIGLPPEELLRKVIPSSINYNFGSSTKVVTVIKGQVLLEESSSISQLVDAYGQKVNFDFRGNTMLLENVELNENKIMATEDGILEVWQEGLNFIFRIYPISIWQINVRISEDRMTARLDMACKAENLVFITMEEVKAALENEQVVHGIKEDTLARCVGEANRSGEINDIIVAVATKPVNEDDEQLVFKVKYPDELIKKYQTKGIENNKEATGDLPQVNAEEVLATLVRSKKIMTAGYDVMGNTVEAKKGNRLNIAYDENCRAEENFEGDLDFIAIKGGGLLYDSKNSKLTIVQHRTVHGDVGSACNSIKFPGTVNVDGEVKSGFFVIAEKEITVKEGVGGALIVSDKSVAIGKGMFGRGKGLIRAGEDISLAFAEQCTLLAHGDIYITRECIDSKIRCSGKLILKDERKGTIVGGDLRARHGLTTVNLGNVAETRTEVYFGQNYLAMEKLEKEQDKVNSIKAQLKKLEMFIEKLTKSKDIERLQIIKKEKNRRLAILDKKKIILSDLNEKLKEHYPSEVVVIGNIYRGVVFHSHSASFIVKKEMKNVRFSYDSEQEEIIVTDGTPRRR